jgi:hypothetical protein
MSGTLRATIQECVHTLSTRHYWCLALLPQSGEHVACDAHAAHAMGMHHEQLGSPMSLSALFLTSCAMVCYVTTPGLAPTYVGDWYQVCGSLMVKG